MPKYRCTTSIGRGPGEKYRRGDVIELSESEAKAYAKAGAIELYFEDDDEPAPTPKPKRRAPPKKRRKMSDPIPTEADA